MPNKPARYGIKLWVTCDAKSSYAWKMQVYTGKEKGKTNENENNGNDGNDKGASSSANKGTLNMSARVVLDLTEGLGPGRNVTCDNFFTSHELARRLFAERGLTVLGTLRANKPEIPRELLQVKGRAVCSSLFAFAEATSSSPRAVAVSYLAKKTKNVLILSTAEAHVKGAALSERPDRKPLAVLDYNRTKGGVDNLDKVLATYSCRRKTSRWPLALFHNMVDVSAYNAFVIRREVDPAWMLGKRNRRRVFLERLGRALATPLICRRERIPRDPVSASLVLSVRTRGELPSRGGEASSAGLPLRSRKENPRAHPHHPHPPPPPPPPPPLEPGKRKRCGVCPRSEDSKTRTACRRCATYICKKCTVTYCPACASWVHEEDEDEEEEEEGDERCDEEYEDG